jgi:hypothetical protein
MWRTIWIGLWFVVGAASATAQSKNKVEITGVRVGFPAGPHSTEPDEMGVKLPIFKLRTWTPVYIDIKCLAKLDSQAELVLENADSDGTLNRIKSTVPILQTGETITQIGYARIGSNDQLQAIVNLANQPISAAFNVRLQGRESVTAIYLSLGAKLAGIKLPTDNKTSTHLNLTEMATIVDVNQMPTVWYGYDGVDLAILNCGNLEFLTALQNEKPNRLAVLAEWVRRGGRIIISVGTNQTTLAQIGDLQPLLPVQLSRLQAVKSITVDWPGSSRQNAPFEADTGKVLEFIELKPKQDDLLRTSNWRDFRVLARVERQPLVVQAAYGLGRVTVVAFDLDRKPFTNWKEQNIFWERLLAGASIRPASSTGMVNEPEGIDQLVHHLDQFEGVPVISFGWVALFILLYILLVGPLDYYILKRFVKRLEWTWITFPTIVLVVSVAAYLTAYSLKGNDQKINKLDLLDIDLQTNRYYGTSWFSVFSPRIQNYTIAVEPTISGASPAQPISWFGKANANHNRLFRQVYDYADLATGLQNVPLRVWSSKAFVAQYEGVFDTKSALIVSNLSHPPAQPDRIQGSITNHLPFALDKAVLMYAGKAYELEKLLPNNETPVVFVQSATEIANWLNTNSGAAIATRQGNMYSEFPFWRLAFADKLSPNSAIRSVIVSGGEQSWRLANENRSEAILLARVMQTNSPAEQLSQPTSGPTRLWLNALPGGSVARASIAGTMRQEIFVRVFIPIANQTASNRK